MLMVKGIRCVERALVSGSERRSCNFHPGSEGRPEIVPSFARCASSPRPRPRSPPDATDEESS